MRYLYSGCLGHHHACRVFAAASLQPLLMLSRHSPICPAFAGLLSANNRLVELGKIVGKFEEIAAEQRGEVKAMVTTAEVRPALAFCLLHIMEPVCCCWLGSATAEGGCRVAPCAPCCKAL